MNRSILIFLTGAVLLGAMPCGAQTVSTAPALSTGQKIRFQTTRYVPFVEGRIRAVSGHTLVVEIDDDRTVPLDVTALSALEVSRDASAMSAVRRKRARIRTALDGALVGGLAAGVVGAVWGWSATQNPVGIHGSMEGFGVIMAFPAAAIGAVIGGAIGYNNPPAEWVPVSITIAPAPEQP
jgi:hypothetical protein